MDRQKIEKAIIKEMEIDALLARQAKLLDGLCESFQDIQSIGLDAGRIISRNSLDVVLKKEYHQYISNGADQVDDSYFKAAFSLVMSRKEVKKTKAKP